MSKQKTNSQDFDYSFDNEASRPISNTSSFSESSKTSPAKPKEDFQAASFEKKLNKSNNKENNKSDDNMKDEAEKKPGGCKKLLIFIIKNFGMIIVVLLYIAGGAFLFKILEQHNEIQFCQQGEGEWNKLKSSYRTKIFNYVYFNTTSNPWLPIDNLTLAYGLYTPKDGPSVYNPKLTQWLTEFRAEIHKLRVNYKFTGQDCENQSLWTYYSSLLFTITVVSTIGYGHVSPTTWEGQIVCICYALLGIPLFVLSTAKVSGLLGDMFRFLYGNILCYSCNNKKKSDNRNKKEDKEERDEENNFDGLSKKDSSGKNSEVIDDNEETDEYETKDRVTVPLVIVLGTFIGYLFIGGAIFNSIEEWSLLESCYFSFVSLATMGFGDYIPGINYILAKKEDIAARNLMLTTVYVFFGMAILGMCFELMQDEFVEKVNLISERFGISKTETVEEGELVGEIDNQTKIKDASGLNDIELNQEKTNMSIWHTNKNTGVIQTKSKEPTLITVKPSNNISDGLDKNTSKRNNETSC